MDSAIFRRDLLWFESYGVGIDMLWMGTWNILQNSENLLVKGNTNKEILDFIKLDREQVLKMLLLI